MGAIGYGRSCGRASGSSFLASLALWLLVLGGDATFSFSYVLSSFVFPVLLSSNRSSSSILTSSCALLCPRVSTAFHSSFRFFSVLAPKVLVGRSALSCANWPIWTSRFRIAASVLFWCDLVSWMNCSSSSSMLLGFSCWFGPWLGCWYGGWYGGWFLCSFPWFLQPEPFVMFLPWLNPGG